MKKILITIIITLAISMPFFAGAISVPWQKTEGGTIFPLNTGDTIVIGGSATTTTGNILEIIGSSFFSDITATSTFAGGLRATGGGIQLDGFTTCNLDTDASGNLVCGTDAAGSGSTFHFDGGGFVAPLDGDYHSAPYYVASSTTATSTFHGAVDIGTTSPYTSSEVNIEVQNPANHGLIIQGASGQTAHNFMVRNNAGDRLFNISANGEVDIIHTATSNEEEALEVDCIAGGFADMKCLDIVFTTGALAAGQEDSAILLTIDHSAATGGDIFGYDIFSTEGGADIYGYVAGATVNPILQLSGDFADMDVASSTADGIDFLDSATSTAQNATMFASDDDVVVIGHASQFEEIEFLLATPASGAGIKPTFEFSTGSGTWTTFNPTDTTNGMRNTGIVEFLLTDVPTWAVGADGNFLIRITRTQNSLTTAPVESKIQIVVAVNYGWDKNAHLDINSLIADSYIDADHFVATSSTATSTLPQTTGTQ
jgi:hypothetical protein